MLYGHMAVGFASKPLVRKVKLGYLIFAATAIDFLCGVFLLTGIEGVDAAGASYIPWSHGLFMAGVEFVPTLALIALIPLGNWVDRHRALRPSRRKSGAQRANVLS